MTYDEEIDSISIHFSKANPYLKALEWNKRIAVFLVTNGYIFHHWYAEKYNVSNWNYTSVLEFGTLHKIENEDELMTLVDQLTIEHEADAESPWSADWSVEKIRKMLNAIVGFELKVERWEEKRKSVKIGLLKTRQVSNVIWKNRLILRTSFSHSKWKQISLTTEKTW